MPGLLPELAKLVSFRPLEPGDVPFVMDSWLKSYRTSPWAGVVPNNRYFEVYGEAITGLLARGAKVHIACAGHDRTKILGWLCSEDVHGGQVIHYVYVKDPYRRKGLGHSLMELYAPNARFYTFRTRPGQYLTEGLSFAPEIGRRE